MTPKRYTYRDNIIYRDGLEYSTLNPDDICSLLDRLEETCNKMDKQIKELKIENHSKFNKEEFEDSLYEAYKFYAEHSNLTYSERLLVADFSDHLIQTDVFHPSKGD
jgi:hypothetical protein